MDEPVYQKQPKRRIIIAQDTKETFRGSYQHYVQYATKRGVKKKRLLSKKDFDSVKSKIFEEIREGVINCEGGVMVKRFGYFFVLRYPGKRDMFKNREGSSRRPFQVRNRIHQPVFEPYRDFTDLRFWSMDYAFSLRVIYRVRDNLLKGEKYKNYLYSLSRDLNLSVGSVKFVEETYDDEYDEHE